MAITRSKLDSTSSKKNASITGGDDNDNEKHDCAKCGEGTSAGNNWVGCDNCGLWFHEQCSGLPKEVWPYIQDKHIFYLCDICVKNKTTIKLLQPSIVETVKKSLQETVPKIINNTLKEVVNPGVATPSSHSFSSSNNSPENTFIINGVPDLGDSEIKQTEDDAVALDKIFSHISEDSANIISARRLGKKRASTQNSSRSQGLSPSGSQGVQCRPLLVTCNPWFLRKCLAKSYKLQDYEHRIYFKKYLTSSERSVEKKLLAKRYELLQSGEYERKQFRIRKLELFYNGVKIPVDGTA